MALFRIAHPTELCAHRALHLPLGALAFVVHLLVEIPVEMIVSGGQGGQPSMRIGGIV
jgi:hypothetical protein